MKKLFFLLFFGFTSALHAEDGWQTLERLCLKNNKKTLKGEILHNYRGFQVEQVTLEFNLPKYIELKSSTGMLLLRLEPDRIETGQPKESPTLAKAWELLLDIRREIATFRHDEPKAFFYAYKDADYFQLRSFYDKPFHGLEITSEDKNIPFEKFTAYFNPDQELQSIRVNFKNGLYGSLTVQP
ncbi:MAG: hypothetical protein R3A80_08815 [Bdellovibrionota bacterium]